MSLVVAPAEGYDALVSLEDADSYCEDMRHVGWTGPDCAKEAALRRATQYLMARYQVKPQYLDPVHKNVKAACCEAALRALSGPLVADVQAQEVVSESVGPIAVTYAPSLRNGGQVRIALVDELLRGLCERAYGTIKLERA